jgi:hypothetical protein
MLSQMNFLSKILATAWIALPRRSLTTVAKHRTKSSGGFAARVRLFQPPPSQSVEELPRHLLRDIGLDRAKA